jgi:hypothetical protein
MLPAYNPGGAVDFSGLNRGLDEGFNALAQGRKRQQNMQVTNALSRGAYGEAQAATDDPALALGIGTAQRQNKAFDQDTQQKAIQQMAGISQMILQAPPEQGRVMMQKMLQSNPALAENLTKYGMDLNDHQGSAKFMIAQARGPRDPYEDQLNQAKLAQMKAQTSATMRGDQPEIVRTMRAAGIQQGSEEWNSTIRRSLKGGSPMDQIIEQALQGGGGGNALQRPPMPQQPQQPQQMPALPQSVPGNGLNPGIQLTNDSAPAPQAPQPPPQDPMVQTPLGMMPASKARVMGFALAYQGKGEAGKMFNDPAADKDKLSKTAEGENDKAEMGLTNQVARLEVMRSKYNEKFLEAPTQIKMWGDTLLSKMGALNPKDRKYLSDYVEFRRASAENMNRFIKEATGATVGVEEAKRLMTETPNAGSGIVDGDDPVTFKTNLEGSLKSSKFAIARARYLRTKGFTGKPWEAGLELGQMQDVIDQTLAPEKQRILNANPNITPQQLKQQLLAVQKREFGI